jgi:hypothetical protein
MAAETKLSVTEYLERAREVAVLADRKTGAEKARLLDIAEAWLKLAETAANEAQKSSVRAAPPLQPKLN